jgi:type I restriction enzyme, S subunit
LALESYIFCNPQTEVWKCLESLLEPLFDKVASHGAESRTLAERCDRLLPKLMSGEIRVKEADRIIEKVM